MSEDTNTLDWNEAGTHASYGKEYRVEDETGEISEVAFYDVGFSESGVCNGKPNYAVSFRGKWLGSVAVCLDADGKWGIADAGMDEAQFEERDAAMEYLGHALVDADEINL